MTVSLDEFAAAGKKFRDAGVDVYAYNYSFRDDFTDGEMERGFEMAKALGAKVITASSNLSTAMRVDPFAKKHQMRVGMHNHSRIRENEFATPDDFDKARPRRLRIHRRQPGHRPFRRRRIRPGSFYRKN